jgi:hypothetical protein
VRLHPTPVSTREPERDRSVGQTEAADLPTPAVALSPPTRPPLRPLSRPPEQLDTDEPRPGCRCFRSDLQDELVHPAHPDVRSGRNQNNVEWSSRFHIPEDRAQPDESGDAIPIYVGATGLRSPRLGNEDAPPGVVLQANCARCAGPSGCAHLDPEPESRTRHLARPRHHEVIAGNGARTRTGPIGGVSGAVVLGVYGSRCAHCGAGQDRQREAPG